MNWSFQLYSARNTPLSESLQIVAEAGYSGVEPFRGNFDDSTAFRQALDSHGLAVPSMHINIGELREQLQMCLDRAKAFDCSHIVCPYLDISERPADAAAWRALAAELSDMAKRLKDAGFEFAWHNHDFELIALADGAVPMQILLEGAPEMSWEIDVAWVVRAAVDPAPWIEQHGARISAVHLKDIAPSGECVDEDGWADLGHGTIPWSSLMTQLLQSPAQIYVMEHDNPSDLKRFASRSIASAKSLSS